MNSKRLLSALVQLSIAAFSPLLVAAPAHKAASPKEVTSFKLAPLATVNGQAVPQMRLDVLLADQLSRGITDSPSLRNALKDELILKTALVQQAEKQGMDKDALIKTRAEMAYDDVLITAYIQKWLLEHPVTEASIKKEFENWVARMGATEYLVRHVLVGSEEEAKGVIARLKNNEKIDDIASKQSRDSNSRNNGGLVNWVGQGFLEKPLINALARAPKGKPLMEPIQTTQGWHVIQLEDSRPFKAPAFEQVQSQIRKNLEQNAINTHINQLRAATKVD